MIIGFLTSPAGLSVCLVVLFFVYILRSWVLEHQESVYDNHGYFYYKSIKPRFNGICGADVIYIRVLKSEMQLLNNNYFEYFDEAFIKMDGKGYKILASSEMFDWLVEITEDHYHQKRKELNI